MNLHLQNFGCENGSTELKVQNMPPMWCLGWRRFLHIWGGKMAVIAICTLRYTPYWRCSYPCFQHTLSSILDSILLHFDLHLAPYLIEQMSIPLHLKKKIKRKTVTFLHRSSAACQRRRPKFRRLTTLYYNPLEYNRCSHRPINPVFK